LQDAFTLLLLFEGNLQMVTLLFLLPQSSI
jgi:hypothetical protein